MLKSVISHYKGAAAAAYLILSFLGYVASSIFYLQLGIWYPDFAGVSDYFLAAIKNFYGVIGVVSLLLAAIFYSFYSYLLVFARWVTDRIFRRPYWSRSVRRIYTMQTRPWMTGQITLMQRISKIIVPGGIVFLYGFLPYAQGNLLWEHPERFQAGPSNRPLMVRLGGRAEEMHMIGSTSEYLFLMNQSLSEIVIYPKEKVEEFRQRLG